jgi:chromosome segregation ATPase
VTDTAPPPGAVVDHPGVALELARRTAHLQDLRNAIVLLEADAHSLEASVLEHEHAVNGAAQAVHEAKAAHAHMMEEHRQVALRLQETRRKIVELRTRYHDMVHPMNRGYE